MADEHDSLVEALLGQAPHLTGDEVAALSGMTRAAADELWQALGFPDLGNERAFTDGDVEALRATGRLARIGVLDDLHRLRAARDLGRAMAGIAETEVALGWEATERGLVDSPFDLLDTLADLQSYIWRRHLLAATERRAARPTAGSAPLVVGFTDLVSYTATSRGLSEDELDALLDSFEHRVQAVVVEHGGRVVKTLGDEVMWVLSSPPAGARAALAMADEGVRTGVALGPTLARGGDHFGPTVNLASRLTKLAKPGAVLIDRELAEALVDEEGLTMKHLRPTSVRGYDHLRATLLKATPPRD